jgi:hypothetical protein
MRQLILVLIFVGAAAIDTTWGGENDSWKTSAQATYYFDSRDFNTAALQSSTKGLPLGFSVFGFVDLHSDQKKSSARFDLSRYFVEYRLQRPLDPRWVGGIRGLSVQAEYDDFAGRGNEVLRFGLTYQHGLSRLAGNKGWLRLRVHPYETDDSGSQASLIYFIPLTTRLSITGFADLNIDTSSPNRWVIEPQLNLRIDRRFQAVAEYRLNEYEGDNSRLDGSGLALGAKILF